MHSFVKYLCKLYEEENQVDGYAYSVVTGIWLVNCIYK